MDGPLLFAESVRAGVVPCSALAVGVQLPLHYRRPTANLLDAALWEGPGRESLPVPGPASADCWASLDGLALASPEGIVFARRNPRIRTLPQMEVETAGRAALVARFESITGAERLAVIADAETYEFLRAEGEGLLDRQLLHRGWRLYAVAATADAALCALWGQFGLVYRRCDDVVRWRCRVRVADDGEHRADRDHATFFSTGAVAMAALLGSAFVDRLGFQRASVVSDLASMVAVALIPLRSTRRWDCRSGWLLALVFVKRGC